MGEHWKHGNFVRVNQTVLQVWEGSRGCSRVVTTDDRIPSESRRDRRGAVGARRLKKKKRTSLSSDKEGDGVCHAWLCDVRGEPLAGGLLRGQR